VRGDWFPRIELQEGWQRGNAPVFAFSSLLSQRRFTEADFAIDTLTHPDPLSNYRAAVIGTQRVFDGGRTRAATQVATAQVQLAEAGRRQTAADVALAVTEAYGRALTADARAAAADGAEAAAMEDLGRVTARRDTGVATDADVLAVTVHLAQVRARGIAARSESAIARAALNRLMAQPLETPLDLAEPPPPSTAPAALDDRVAALRPDVIQAARRVDVARAGRLTARAALLPSIGLEGGYEWHGGTWSDRAGAWMAGVRAQISLSAIGAEAASAHAAQSALDRAVLQQADVEAAARLDIRTASARLESARARQAVAAGVVAQARESQRIIRDRFGAGLATTTEVLRAAEALLDAEALAIDTRVELTVAAAALARALGRTPGGAP
jgi:outer membrane protein TolC